MLDHNSLEKLVISRRFHAFASEQLIPPIDNMNESAETHQLAHLHGLRLGCILIRKERELLALCAIEQQLLDDSGRSFSGVSETDTHSASPCCAGATSAMLRCFRVDQLRIDRALIDAFVWFLIKNRASARMNVPIPPHVRHALSGSLKEKKFGCSSPIVKWCSEQAKPW